MSLVKDIADFLAAQGLGTVASTIFYGDLPDVPDSLICLFEYAGLPPLPNELLDRPGLQVRVRGTAYETARAAIQSVQNLLMRVGYPDDSVYFDGVRLNNIDYLRIIPAQGITPMGKDSRDRIELVQNFYVTKRR